MKGRGLFAWGIVLFVIGLLLFGGWVILGQYNKRTTTVTAGGTAFKATVVADEESREKGLSGVDELRDGTAMLFVFPDDGAQGIWMKDMNINIDIVWLNEAKKVTHVERNVTPASYPNKIYKSPNLSRYVLEIPAGAASRAGISDGITATFDLPANLKIE